MNARGGTGNLGRARFALEMREFDAQFEIAPFLARMPFRRDDMREQLSRNFTRALEDTT